MNSYSFWRYDEVTIDNEERETGDTAETAG
jgi:hypothetical protein